MAEATRDEVRAQPFMAQPQVLGPGRWIVAALWVVWAALLWGGFAIGGSEDEQVRIPTWCRMESSVVLVLAGWVYYFMAAGTAAAPFAASITIGMLLGLMGDLSNGDLLPIPNPIMGGILAFALGHIAYIRGCLSLREPLAIRGTRAVLGPVLVWQIVGLVGWFLVVFSSGPMGLLHWAALPYSLLLAGTAGCATMLALANRAFVPLAIGAALFLFSDLVLAWRIFRGPFAHGGDLVWLTYGPGQMLIVYSIGAAIRLCGRPNAA